MLQLKSFTIEDLDRSGGYPFHFHCAQWFVTRILAQMLDSSVRVSRRVEGDHFVSRDLSLPSIRKQQSGLSYEMAQGGGQ